VPGVSTYSWSLPAGLVLSSGQGTAQIVATYSSAAAHSGIRGTISVLPANACFTGSAVTAMADLNISVPVAPASISGPTRLCPGDVATFSVAAVSRASSYIWSLPAGVSILNGAGTNVIRVTVGQGYAGGAISAAALNACGIGSSRTKNLLLNSPNVPGAISGISSGLCGLSGLLYAVPAQISVQGYQWTVPSGATIVSGQGSNSIKLNFGAGFSTGNLAVIAQNSCGNSLPRSISLNALPAQPGTISGPQNICPGTQGIAYSINTVQGAQNYAWNVFTGATIAAGQGTKNISINVGLSWALNPGITVVASNACGSSPQRSLSGINISPDFCVRLAKSDKPISIYPNPAHSEIQFSYTGTQPERIELYNMLGERVMDGPWQTSMNIRHLQAGLYILRISGESTEVMRLEVVR